MHTGDRPASTRSCLLGIAHANSSCEDVPRYLWYSLENFRELLSPMLSYRYGMMARCAARMLAAYGTRWWLISDRIKQALPLLGQGEGVRKSLHGANWRTAVRRPSPASPAWRETLVGGNIEADLPSRKFLGTIQGGAHAASGRHLVPLGFLRSTRLTHRGGT